LRIPVLGRLFGSLAINLFRLPLTEKPATAGGTLRYDQSDGRRQLNVIFLQVVPMPDKTEAQY